MFRIMFGTTYRRLFVDCLAFPVLPFAFVSPAHMHHVKRRERQESEIVEPTNERRKVRHEVERKDEIKQRQGEQGLGFPVAFRILEISKDSAPRGRNVVSHAPYHTTRLCHISWIYAKLVWHERALPNHARV